MGFGVCWHVTIWVAQGCTDDWEAEFVGAVDLGPGVDAAVFCLLWVAELNGAGHALELLPVRLLPADRARQHELAGLVQQFLCCCGTQKRCMSRAAKLCEGWASADAAVAAWVLLPLLAAVLLKADCRLRTTGRILVVSSISASLLLSTRSQNCEVGFEAANEASIIASKHTKEVRA